MKTPLDILRTYWQYPAFRGEQENIIEAVLNGKDTIAILPTGGGKSLCYQVPAMAREGICVVISPLIALIKDQVDDLKTKGIKALNLAGGLSYYDLDTALDNGIYGNYKFIYLSPERLQQELVQERLKQMPVNLIAIDEAHCISQWGNDFRPAYRNCKILKEWFPNVPLIALTATATRKVVADIEDNLQMKDPFKTSTSLNRANLAYMVFQVEDKQIHLEKILTKNPESSIVYVRSRNATEQLTNYLQSKGFTATFFHGGLSTEEKNTRLKQWLSEKVQVMVATNAFGMGINKPNVRTVIHFSIPESIENYFQEAGRAGRDGAKSYAVLFTQEDEKKHLKTQFLNTTPSVSFIKVLYRKLTNYFQISYGEGEGQSFSFHFPTFCSTYQFSALMAYNALKTLDRHSILAFSEHFHRKATIQCLVSSQQLFVYLDNNPRMQSMVQTILRTYAGVFDNPTPINIELIATKSRLEESYIFRLLEQLEKDAIIQYQGESTDAEITFLTPREDDKTINMIAKSIETQNLQKEHQMEAMLQYLNNENECRSKLLLTYFGQTENSDCGICSTCIQKSKHFPLLYKQS